MGFLENIRVALSAVRSNLLRSILTVMIIAVGIMALIGILTAIDTAIYSFNDNFSSLGANSVSIYMTGTGTATVKHENEKTNPNIRLTGIDENYLNLRGLELETGRALSFNEIQNGNNRAIIGKDIVDLLFKGKSDQALGKVISVGNIKYKVIGVLISKGSSMNQSEDKVVLVPLLSVKTHRSHRHLPDRWDHRHYPRHFNGKYCHLFFRRKFLDALALDRRRRGDLYDRRFIFGIISGLEGF